VCDSYSAVLVARQPPAANVGNVTLRNLNSDLCILYASVFSCVRTLTTWRCPHSLLLSPACRVNSSSRARARTDTVPFHKPC